MANPLAHNDLASKTIAQLATELITQGSEADSSLVESIANVILANAEEPANEIWDKLLVSAKNNQDVEAFISDISVGTFKSYKELVDSRTTPCAKLICIHLSNTLIANKVAIADAAALNLEGYRGTRYLLSGEFKYSLRPFQFAYFPKMESFVELFKARVYGLTLTPHDCLNKALYEVADDIIKLIRPGVLWTADGELDPMARAAASYDTINTVDQMLDTTTVSGLSGWFAFLVPWHLKNHMS